MALNREKVVRNAEKYVSRGKLEAAIKEYRKVLRENPNDTNTLNRVGDLYARLERFDEAVRLFSQIAEKYTDDGFFVKAIAIYKKIIKFDPSALSVYERLAELYHRQGLPNESRSQFQFLADYYLKNNNLTSATTIYQRMAELEPANPTYRLKLAELFEEQRFPEKSVREYEALAAIMLDADSPDEAVHVFNKALELQPENLDLVRSFVGDLHDRGFTGAAAKVLSKAVDLNPQAATLADEIRLEEPETETETAEATEEPAEDAKAAVEVAEVEIDATFDAPETSFDLDAAAEEAMAAIDAADEVAELAESMDLDDDDSMYEIKPPDDMPDGPGLGFDDEFDLEVPTEAEPAAVDDVVVDFQGMDADLAADFDDQPVEIEAGDDDESFEIEAGDFDDQPVEIEAGDDDESFEIELEVDLEEFEDEPVEEVVAVEDVSTPAAVEAPEALEEDELVVDLEDFEEELVEVTGAAEEPVVEVEESSEEAEAEEVADARPVRREEDLVAEAKVFSKYGLAEKARDRLDELLEVNPAHLEGLQLLARMELEGGDSESALALAGRLADASKEAGDSDLYDELRGDFAVEDLVLEALDLPGASPDISPEQDLTPDDAILAESPESTELEPIAAELDEDVPEPAAAEPAEEPVAVEPVEVEPAAVEVSGVEPATAEPTEAEPVPVEPEEAELASAEAAETEPTAAEAVEVEPVSIEPEEDEPASVEATDAEPASVETVEAESAAAEPEDAEPAAVEPAEVESVASKAKAKRSKDRIAQLLEDLSLDAFDAPTRRPRSVQDEPRPAAVDPEPVTPEPAVSELAATAPTSEPVSGPVIPEVVAGGTAAESAPEPTEADAEDIEPAAAEPAVAAPAASKGGLFSLKDELDLDDLVDQEDDEEIVVAAGQETDAVEDVASEPADSAEDSLDETGMSWLEDVEPVPAASESGEGLEDLDSLFDEEDDFFDLAAELEEELGADAMARVDGDVSSLESQEGTLEEIIEGFKQGVADHLSEEDYETHFNLGIAYREMGLLDEAIGEFQVASKDEAHLADSAGMLGMCFMEKGLPELAIRWYKKGLEASEISEEATLGLLYDLASTYESMGEPESAYRTFVEIYGINTNFRDVAGKMQELAPQKPA